MNLHYLLQIVTEFGAVTRILNSGPDRIVRVNNSGFSWPFAQTRATLHHRFYVAIKRATMFIIMKSKSHSGRANPIASHPSGSVVDTKREGFAVLSLIIPLNNSLCHVVVVSRPQITDISIAMR